MAKVFYDPLACALIDQSLLSDKCNAAGGPLMREAAERIEGFTLQKVSESRTLLDSEIVERADYQIFHPDVGVCIRVSVRFVSSSGRVTFSRVDAAGFIEEPRYFLTRSLFLGMRAAAAVIEANK